MDNKRFTVLSIEDNKPDFILLKKALDSIPDIKLDIINVSNGKEAIEFLNKENKYKNSPIPDIIILDINLPLIDGKEVLKSIKNDINLRIIPVIIFSSSDYYADIEEAYRSYANSYITKTFDIKELFEKIVTMGSYWLKTNETTINNNFYFIQDKE